MSIPPRAAEQQEGQAQVHEFRSARSIVLYAFQTGPPFSSWRSPWLLGPSDPLEQVAVCQAVTLCGGPMADRRLNPFRRQSVMTADLLSGSQGIERSSTRKWRPAHCMYELGGPHSTPSLGRRVFVVGSCLRGQSRSACEAQSERPNRTRSKPQGRRYKAVPIKNEPLGVCGSDRIEEQQTLWRGYRPRNQTAVVAYCLVQIHEAQANHTL